LWILRFEIEVKGKKWKEFPKARSLYRFFQCWVVLTFSWESLILIFGQVLRITPVFLVFFKIFPFWKSPRFLEFKKKIKLGDFQGQCFSQTFEPSIFKDNSHKLVLTNHGLLFYIFIYLYSFYFFTFLLFFLVSFLTIKVFFFWQNFALLQNLKITYNKLKGFYFFSKNFPKKALFATFKLCASRSN